jgi:hypothetical protein
VTVEQYDRLSILYADAHKALAEAQSLLLDAGGRAGLSAGTHAAVTLSEYLCDEIERYAPHSVKA